MWSSGAYSSWLLGLEFDPMWRVQGNGRARWRVNWAGQGERWIEEVE